MSIELYLRRYVLVSLPMLALSLAFIPVRSALAQTAAPDSVSAQAQGPNAISLQWVACQTSDQPNCAETFFIYRNPPSLDTTLVTVSVNGNASAQQYLDRNLEPATQYTYLVCSGAKVTDASNCGQASATTFASSSSSGGNGGSSGGSGYQGSVNDTNTSAPPTNLRALAGDTAVLLDWQNPQSDFPIVIEIYRALTGGSAASQIAILNGDASAKIPPTQYQDNGPLGPHYPYDYYVCDGSYDVQMRNCAHSNPVSTWGANPLMNATRSNPTTVKLSVAVDNLTTLSSLKITRQDNSGPCGQGTALASGQGCKTTSYGPNGVPINAPVITTIYDKGRPGTDFGASTASAPYVIDISDDTVTAGVEYFYQAHATWNGAVEQDSQTTTVPGGFKYLPQHQVVKKLPAGVKAVGVQPVGGTGGKGKTPQTAATSAVAAARSAAQAKVKANPADAQSLYTLGQSYCRQNLKDACVSTLYMGFLQSQKTGSAALTTQIKASLAAQGVTIK